MNLEFETQNCWEVYSKQEKKINSLAQKYLKFLSQNKTERETINYVRQILQEKGFSEDFSQEKVYRILHHKTIFIARKGKRPLQEGIRLIGAHADTPRLDLKQHPFYEECEVALAKTHYYGGIRKHQWLARPLALHGVIVKTSGEKVEINLGEHPEDPVFTIADLLPHLAYKQIEKKVSEAFEAEKLNVILGHIPLKQAKEKKIKNHLLKLLQERFGLKEEDFFSAEVQAVPAGPAREVGLDRGLIGGYGQDDRICVFLALEAFLASEIPEHTQVLVFWDKEEIGSEGSSGAKSLFLEYCLKDLLLAWEEKNTSFAQMLLNSKAISADVHAAMDPDYQEVHEKLNASLLGKGPVMCKFTGHRGKYGANDAHAEYVAWLRNLLNQQQIPWQMAELGKVDLGGGGTVAKYLAIYGLEIIDFGPGVLSMHSPFELSSKADLYATFLAYKYFLNT
ncbi:MAG: hypothetical protein PWR24_1572 [Desulfonauticus sp.]|jgi:aspartyl aminopeptidase|nr:MAG: M18 family aminopeptidase [Desulfonauticus sp. 38_4375]MDK2922015.1 hypothetical protein [Desulfonauticus sp.]